MELYKLVVRDSNGQVKQIHELHLPDIESYIGIETGRGYSVTVTQLRPNPVERPETCGTSGHTDRVV